MQIVSTLWNDYYADTESTLEHKIVIGTDEYLNNDIYSITLSAGLCPDAVFSVGNMMARKLDLIVNIKPTVIPRMASVDLYIRFNGASGVTEWIPKGKYFIDTRAKSSGRIDLECYDSTLKLEKSFIQAEAIADFPMLMSDAMDVITTRLGLVFENPSSVNATYKIEYPNETSMREVMGYIASANGGNFVFTDEGKIRLVVALPSTSIEDVSHKSFEQMNDQRTISRVTMFWDAENFFTSGDDTADELVISNKWATQTMCDNVLAMYVGYTHNPYECGGAFINPAMELGDFVTMGTFGGIIFNYTATFKADVVYNISAPGESILDHEYPYEGEYAKAIQNRVGLNTPYYGVSISRANGLVIEKTDGLAKVVFNSDELKFQTLENGVYTDSLYFDPIEKKYIFNGELSADLITVLSGLITPSLYAEKAAIAELTVDSIDTSNKTEMYLTQDTGDVNYFKAEGERIDFITARTDGSATENVYDAKLNMLYWVNASHMNVTEEVTPFPVLIYDYIIDKKMSIAFEEVPMFDGSYVQSPVLSMGIGSGEGPFGTFKMHKNIHGVDFVYLNSTNGKERSMKLTDDGIVFTPGISDLYVDKNIGAFSGVLYTSEMREFILDTDSSVQYDLNIDVSSGVSEVELKLFMNNVEVRSHIRNVNSPDGFNIQGIIQDKDFGKYEFYFTITALNSISIPDERLVFVWDVRNDLTASFDDNPNKLIIQQWTNRGILLSNSIDIEVGTVIETVSANAKDVMKNIIADNVVGIPLDLMDINVIINITDELSAYPIPPKIVSVVETLGGGVGALIESPIATIDLTESVPIIEVTDVLQLSVVEVYIPADLSGTLLFAITVVPQNLVETYSLVLT